MSSCRVIKLLWKLKRENHRIKESGSPSGLSPNCLHAHELGRDRETSNGGLYKSDIIVNDFCAQLYGKCHQ